MALILDLGVFAAVLTVWSWPGIDAGQGPRIRLWHQAVGWSLSLPFAVGVQLQLAKQSRAWSLVIGALTLLIALNAAANIGSLVGLAQGAKGAWLWHFPEYAHLLIAGAILPLIWAAEIQDRRRGVIRDWLHAAGLLAATGLGAMALAQHAAALWR